MSEGDKPDRERVEYWNRILRPYWGADTQRSVTQLLTSAIPFVLLWYAMLRSLEVGYWLTLLLLLFSIGPLFHFLIKHRYPWDIPRDWRHAWRSVWLTNAALAGVVAVMWMTIGIQRFLMVQAPVTSLACALGVWLFYVQHQFEHTYWHWHENWDYYDASLHGSSYLVLPRPLQWMTANIGVHHIHHMSARIPNYKLQQVHDENPEFQVVTRVTMRDTWRLVNLTLWDEVGQRLIRFRDLKTMQPAA